MLALLAIFFLLGFLGTLLLTPLSIRIALRFGAVDYPGKRKVHVSPVPRLGGLAIFTTFALVALFAIPLIPIIRKSFFTNISFWLSFGVGATIIFLLGVIDDFRPLPIWAKFFVQCVAGGLVMAYGGVLVEQVANPFGQSIRLDWLVIPFTILWIVGVTNAFNLIDGLDGLAGGIGLISTGTLLIIALSRDWRGFVVLFLACLAGALVGFLRYNFHPARIFLGDSGSMLLGYMLAVLSVVASSKRTTSLAILIPILIVGIPVFETLYAMGRRLSKKVFVEKERSLSSVRSMFLADREHIHHRLLEMGYAHMTTVFILYGLALALAVFALVAAIADDDRVSVGLILIGFAGFFLVQKVGRVFSAKTPPDTGEGPVD